MGNCVSGQQSKQREIPSKPKRVEEIPRLEFEEAWQGSSGDELSLRSVSSDEFKSTSLNLSLSDQGSIGLSIPSRSSSACSVYVHPNESRNLDESRNLTSISSFKNSDDSLSQSLPRVSSSGNLDIEAFARKVNDKLRKLSGSQTRAASVIRRLDRAIVNAMNKIQNVRARMSSKVSPMMVSEQGESQSTQESVENLDVMTVSDYED